MGLSVILLPQSRGFNDGVLCLGVSNGDVVSYARVEADEKVWADGGWIYIKSSLQQKEPENTPIRDRFMPRGVLMHTKTLGHSR